MLAHANIFMLYTANMAAKAVQVSLDIDLLEKIDRDPETRAVGRSAFVTHAVELYFVAKQRAAVDEQLRRAYGGKAAELAKEVDELIEAQAWPPR
jgi:predicted RNA-binding protein YlxR (DUF448 family)